MKKTILIIISLILLTFTLIFLLLKPYNIQKELEKYNTFMTKTINSFQKFPILESGEITGNVYYQGAHKEPYPVNINYNFFLEEDNLMIENEKGFTNILWNQEVLELIKMLKKIKGTDNILEIISHEKTEFQLNVQKLNDTFHTNIKEAKGSIHTKGLQKKIENITLNLDDITITLKENRFIITKLNTKLDGYILEQGFSLNINDKLKIQAELVNDTNKYHVILENNVFSLVEKENTFDFNITTPKENFHSLELTFTPKIIDKTKEKQLDEQMDPIKKYINALQLPDWRSLI